MDCGLEDPLPPWPWLATHHMSEHVSCNRQLCTICLSACAALKNGPNPFAAWWTLLSPCGVFCFSMESCVLTWQLPGTLLSWHPGRWKKTHPSLISFTADLIIHQSFLTSLKWCVYLMWDKLWLLWNLTSEMLKENSQGGWQETISKLA